MVATAVRTGTELHRELDRRASAVADQVVGWRHDIHQHPELSNREVRTAELVADHLRGLGLDEVRTGIAGHGVVGLLHGGAGGERVMALRADIDALPVKEDTGESFASTVVDQDYPGGPFPVAHACGHDCHTAMLMGAATVLAGARDSLPGTVLFVFQPAEEGPPVDEIGGARAMLDAGALADPKPSMVFGVHVAPFPKGYVAYRAGNQYSASCLVKIVITGQQVHGSTPWQGVDPMPAAGDILSGIGQLYRQVPAYDPVTVSIGHIEDVGRFNIIGQTVTLWGAIRATVEADMSGLQDRLRRLVEHHAQAYGCTARTAFLQPVPAVHNTPSWVDASLPTLRRVVGADHVVPTAPTLGYDDVSVFVNTFGGLYVMLGVQDTVMREGAPVPAKTGRGMYPNHSPKFYADDGPLVTGVRLHAHMTADHLQGNPEP